MNASMWTFLLVASFVSVSKVAAQTTNISFSTPYPYETESVYAYCTRPGYSWSNIAGFAFWAVDSAQTHYHELWRNCSSGEIIQTNSTMNGRFSTATQSLAFLWKNLTLTDGNKNYSCSLRPCANESYAMNSGATALNVLRIVRPPVWLSPTETVIQVYENQLTRITFQCNAASLNADESLVMCLNYVNTSGTQRNCLTSHEIGNNTVTSIVSTFFPRNAAASSYFNCYTMNRLNQQPSYASGRTLQVNYVTDTITFSVGQLPSYVQFYHLGYNNYELRVLLTATYSFKFECFANGVPEPVVSVSKVTGLSTNEYYVSGAAFSSPSVYMSTGSQFNVYCQSKYTNSLVGSTVVNGSLLVRFSASSRSSSSVVLLALLLALSFLKMFH